jgi:hypothetical protein
MKRRSVRHCHDRAAAAGCGELGGELGEQRGDRERGVRRDGLRVRDLSLTSERLRSAGLG